MAHDRNHEVSEKKTDKDHDKDESAKRMVTDSQNDKDNKNVIEQKKNNSEANKTVNALFGVMDIDTVVAVRRNEEKKAGFEDSVQDCLPYSWAKEGNWSIGPAQMQTKHIEQLKADPRYAETLKDADPYTEDGADKFVAAYLDREAVRLNNGEYAAGKTDRPRDGSPEAPTAREAARFEELQRRWDEAKNSCNPDEMRKILIETYNSGNGSRQVAEVESIRTGEQIAA